MRADEGQIEPGWCEWWIPPLVLARRQALRREAPGHRRGVGSRHARSLRGEPCGARKAVEFSEPGAQFRSDGKTLVFLAARRIPPCHRCSDVALHRDGNVREGRKHETIGRVDDPLSTSPLFLSSLPPTCLVAVSVLYPLQLVAPTRSQQKGPFSAAEHPDALLFPRSSVGDEHGPYRALGTRRGHRRACRSPRSCH